VQMQSGTTGINTMRIYNPVKQGYDHDAAGVFVRSYVPEIAALPDAFIHEPWLWPGAGTLPYPLPIVDCALAAKAARDALYGVRKSPDHKASARKIVEKHGSRKTGMPMTGQSQRKKPKPKPSAQMTLDF
jgi:deoxyribodipyrimidine photo-lyase